MEVSEWLVRMEWTRTQAYGNGISWLELLVLYEKWAKDEGRHAIGGEADKIDEELSSFKATVKQGHEDTRRRHIQALSCGPPEARDHWSGARKRASIHQRMAAPCRGGEQVPLPRGFACSRRSAHR